MRAVVGAIRARHGLTTQLEIARHLGVTEKTLANWLHGRHIPDDASTALLAEASGVDCAALLAYHAALRSPTPEGRARWLSVVRRLVATANIAERPNGENPFGINSLAAVSAN